MIRAPLTAWDTKVIGSVGTWRSLVAHLHGVQGVGGSNPLVPTNSILRFWHQFEIAKSTLTSCIAP